jgi:RNA polymerase sigma factor (TIGR02999 family)
VPDDITGLLLAHQQGDRLAFERLLPLIYDDLKRVAGRQRRRARSGDTLNTTALVHDVYLHLVDETRIAWEGRAHFLGIAAHAMRQILIDYARGRGRQKRGGGAEHTSLDEARVAASDEAERMLELDLALRKLADVDSRLVLVVECRYFAGFSEQETADAMGVSLRTAQRDWLRARAWLRGELGTHA